METDTKIEGEDKILLLLEKYSDRDKLKIIGFTYTNLRNKIIKTPETNQ